jgi:hypothetical protein
MGEKKPTTWIERRMADVEAWRAKNASIREHAVTIYEALWNEILGHVNEAQQKGFPVSTNGEPRRRLVSLEKKQKHGDCWQFELILVDAKDRIHATGDRVEVMLDLDVCEDGVVCLKLAGSMILIEDAAKRILDPFLFPQLQGR